MSAFRCSWFAALSASVLLAGSCLVAPAAVPSAPYAWRNVAVRGGGYVTGLTFHPREADLLYARTDVGGAYRWDAARRAWLPLNDSFDRAHNDLFAVLSVALDPHDPAKVYLACGAYFAEWARTAAVLSSSDRGATWEIAELPLKLGGNQDGRGTGERLQVDPHDGRHLLLGTNHDGLWRSRDSGRTWMQVPGFSPSGATFVLFDATSGQDGRATPVVYAGAADTAKETLYRSADGGKTWTPVAGQPRGLLWHHAAIDDRGVLFLAGGDGLGPNGVTTGAVWKFEPANGRWTDISPVRPDAAQNDTFGYAGLALDPRLPGTLYVSTLNRWTKGDEIFRSTDNGGSWVPLLAHSQFNPAGAPYVKHLKPHWISDLAIDPAHTERLWFVTGYGVWATDRANADVDTGKPIVWMFPNKGLEETVVDELISPPQGAPLLSAMPDLGGFRHDNLAVSPANGFFQPHHSHNPGIAFAERAPHLMVRTHWGPTRGALSRDGGATWENFATAPEPATKHGPGIAALSADGTRLVWLPKGGKPFYSTDGGATWHESRASLVATTSWESYGPVADRVNPLRFYLYDPMVGALHASADGGVSFERIRGLPAKAGKLRAEPGVEGSLWLPTEEALLVSRDGGKTFRPLAGVSAARQVGFGAPAPGRSEAAIFLDGTVRNEDAFFRSDDGGDTWVRLNDARLRLGWLRCLSGDPRVHGRVYLGTSGRGIFVGEPLPK